MLRGTILRSCIFESLACIISVLCCVFCLFELPASPCLDVKGGVEELNARIGCEANPAGEKGECTDHAEPSLETAHIVGLVGVTAGTSHMLCVTLRGLLAAVASTGLTWRSKDAVWCQVRQAAEKLALLRCSDMIEVYDNTV